MRCLSRTRPDRTTNPGPLQNNLYGRHCSGRQQCLWYRGTVWAGESEQRLLGDIFNVFQLSLMTRLAISLCGGYCSYGSDMVINRVGMAEKDSRILGASQDWLETLEAGVGNSKTISIGFFELHFIIFSGLMTQALSLQAEMQMFSPVRDVALVCKWIAPTSRLAKKPQG